MIRFLKHYIGIYIYEYIIIMIIIIIIIRRRRRIAIEDKFTLTKFS